MPVFVIHLIDGLQLGALVIDYTNYKVKFLSRYLHQLVSLQFHLLKVDESLVLGFAIFFRQFREAYLNLEVRIRKGYDVGEA